jgi:putative ABC transport system permease protein
MWRNYLTVGFRALLKNRTYAFINIFGLAVGLAACLLLILYVRYETSYDRWLPNAENVYQLQSHARNPTTGDEFKLQMSQYVAGTALLQSFPEVEARAYVTGTGPIVLRGGEALAVEEALGTDGRLFDVLDLPLVRGDRRTALARPQDVVLSETEARRLFGSEDPLGKTLTLVQRGQHVDHRVTGVMRDLPRASHLRARMIIRYDPAVWFAEFPDFMTSWGETSGWNYVRLRPGTDVARIHAAMPAWERRNIPPREGTREPGGANEDWRLVNVRDVHMGEAQLGAMSPGNDRRTIFTFSVVAFLILLMAVVNFTNLATARASQRAREVALRKVLGAGRRQLIFQFLSESLLLAGVAMLLALTASELLLPPLANFLDADLSMRYLGEGGLLLPIVGLLLLVGAVGGLYPAFYLSRFQPAQVLKANKSASEAAGTGRLRSILVVAQFAVSIGLIICTAIVWSQTVHARSADPGFRREGVIQIENIGRRQVAAQAESLKRELERVEGVRFVSRTAIGIATGSTMGRDVWLPGAEQPIGIGNYAVDEDFFATMGIERIAGRTFDPNRPMDVLDVPTDTTDEEAQRALAARGGNVVVNELAARRLGFRNPADAVGRQVRVQLFPFNPESGLVPVTIIGVVKDTRWRSIRLPVEPIMYRLGRDYAAYVAVRYDSSDPAALRERLSASWRRLFPDVPFQADFSEDIVAELYAHEAARAQVFAGFSMLAIVVACLGLFGLAAFTAERRTKEIGIRKVLGARSRDIVRLLAWQFSKPVIVANLIAWPVAWWAMRDWLNDFDTRIDLGPAPFLLAAVAALVIAIGTIAGHAVKVARANPIHALRYE